MNELQTLRELRLRCLYESSTWLAELVDALLRLGTLSNCAEPQRCNMSLFRAKTLMMSRELQRASHSLSSCGDADRRSSFVRRYSAFLVGEKHRLERVAGEGKISNGWISSSSSAAAAAAAAASGSGTGSGGGGSLEVCGGGVVGVLRSGGGQVVVNDQLHELAEALRGDDERGLLDGFELYLYAMILRSMGSFRRAAQIAVRAVDAVPMLYGVWQELALVCGSHLGLQGVLDAVAQSGGGGGDENDNGDNDDDNDGGDKCRALCRRHWIGGFFHVRRAMERGDERGALARLDELAAVLGEHCATVQSARAVCLGRLARRGDGDMSEALDAFEALRANHPQRLADLPDYAELLLACDDDGAELSNLARAAMAIDEARPESCHAVAVYYVAKGAYKRAIELLQRAVRMNERYAAGWRALGIAYLDDENATRGIEALHRAVSIDARDCAAWCQLARGYQMRAKAIGDSSLVASATYYQHRAVALQPRSDMALLALGVLFEALGNVDAALRNYDRAIALNSTRARFYRARITNDFDDAVLYVQSVNAVLHKRIAPQRVTRHRLRLTFAQLSTDDQDNYCSALKSIDAMAPLDFDVGQQADVMNLLGDENDSLLDDEEQDESSTMEEQGSLEQSSIMEEQSSIMEESSILDTDSE
jgi:tetratricopeptide (TPR) repeat protein